MTSPIERLSGLVIGSVESVSPHEIRIALDLDAPQATALNTGVPAGFPRLNGYVLLPNESGATVGYISWIGIERSPYPKRTGLKDFGLIDLPFPLRKMAVCPLGTLTMNQEPGTKAVKYGLTRGVLAFPSVGDQVLIATSEQVEAIVGANDPERCVPLGVSPMSPNATIKVNPDKIFGRHLAVLGNTGSGKSCTVAGLVRWSIKAAQAQLEDKQATPNCRFIVLDPNGEYAHAFTDMKDRVRVFRPGAVENPFLLPAWLWNSHEWSAVAQAAPATQRPLLVQSIRDLRAGRVAREPPTTGAVRQLRLYRAKLNAFIADGTGSSYSGFPGSGNAGRVIENMAVVMADRAARVDDEKQREAFEAIAQAASDLAKGHLWKSNPGKTGYNDFNTTEFEAIIPLFEAAQELLPKTAEEDATSEDIPVPFDISKLPEHIETLAADNLSNANFANFVAYLTLRIRSLLSERRLASVVVPDKDISLEQWLTDYIGADGASNGQVAIIDLSLIPPELTHTCIAVLGRLIFEAMQRYRRLQSDGKTLPTVLVLEEAHTFIKQESSEDAAVWPAIKLCRETFERIAREGRKFGLGMVLSSQRPSELSQTVLAQCNTFILHRIVNDRDQNLVSRLVPDNVGALLRELSSLPSRQAILLGWATPLPVLVEVNELPDGHRPLSEDPDFWRVWTGREKRPIDWKTLASDWTGDPLPEGE